MTKNSFSYDPSLGILGNLYNLLNTYGIITKTKKFVELILGEDNSTNNNLWSNIKYCDYFPAGPYATICNLLKDEHSYKTRVEKYTSSITDSIQKEINFYLLIIINEASTYRTGGYNAKRQASQIYNSVEKTKLIAYYRAKSNEFSLARNIYLMIYYAVQKKTPTNFFFGVAYEKDLKEFTEKVLFKYGVVSEPGIREIYELAQDGNVFALYEYADMLYYGKNDTRTVDFQKAFEYYERCAGMTGTTQTEKERCNPLALWSLSYIYYNYKPNNPSPSRHIAKLDCLDFEKRLEVAINYAKSAYALNKCAPATNMLGVISLNEDEQTRQKFELYSPRKYFEEAASNGYVYSYNRLALMDASEIFLDPEHKEKHLANYITHLTSASNMHENWATNRLGCFYLEGEVFCFINGTRHSIIFEKYKNPQQARKCFEACFTLIDSNSAWAYANMIIYFRESRLDHETITHYIAEIRRLNMPNVIEYLKNRLPKSEIELYL